MSGPLSPGDLKDLAECSREVLSVLDHPNTDEWASRVSKHAMTLLRADRMFIVLPGTGGGFSLHFSDDEMRCAANAYQTYFHAADVWTGSIRKSLGLDVYLHDMLLRPGDERSEFWNDYILAHRLYQPAGLSCDVEACPVPASLIGYKDLPNAKPFGHRELEILRVLHPAFAAAVKGLGRFRAAHRELESCVDQLPTPALMVGLGGVVHANAAFVRTLGTRIDSVARAVVPTVTKLLRHRHSLGFETAGTVAGPDGRPVPWSLSLLSSVAGGPIALVHFRVATKVRITGETRERLGLTSRQAEVAELIAEGRTHREIATALGIRPSTARHHWEHVLQRLGVRSRSDLRERLSSLGA